MDHICTSSTNSSEAGVYLVSLAPVHVKTAVTDRHPFNGLFSTTISVASTRKVKPFWILMKQEMMGRQWHQLDHLHLVQYR